MGIVYYKYKSAKETYSVHLPHSFVSVSELKQLILASNRHGQGRTRGRGPREDIAISNAQTGEDYADESAMIPQNVTVLVRRIAGQQSENIVLFSSRKVTEDGSLASNKSVVTDSTSKSCSSTEVQDEDAAITAVIDAAQLKWEEQPSKRGQAGGRFTSGRHHGHGPLEGEAPPPGYVCRSCGVPGHFIQHCSQDNRTPPPGYTCYRCRIPGHFIHHCPTIGDTKFDNYRVSHSLAPIVSASPIDGVPSALAPAASVSVVDNLPAELHCRLCNKVMTDAVLTSKCCFDSFCDKCIRDYIITQSKCVCGATVLADDLIPNHTLRSTITNMLATRASSATSDTGRHKSSSGSNPDQKSPSHTPPSTLERVLKQSVDHQLSSATPDVGLQVAIGDDQVKRPQENVVMHNLKSKNEGNSAGRSREKAVPSVDSLKLKDESESTVKDTTVSGTLEPKTARTDQLKKKRKKAGSTKVDRPNIADYGYDIPFDPAYCNPFNSGYPWVTDPYMYISPGMPYGGYPMAPYGVNSISNMPPHPMAPYGVNSISHMPPQALAMQGYPGNYQSWETQSTVHRDAAEATVRSRQAGRPKDFESRNRSQSRPERTERDHGLSDRASSDYNVDHPSRKRDHGHSDRASNDHNLDHHSRGRDHVRSDRASNDHNLDHHSRRRDHVRSDRASNDYDDDYHSRKRMCTSSPMDGDKQSRRQSRHSSRSLACDGSSDEDECNFKRRWGHRSSVTGDARS